MGQEALNGFFSAVKVAQGIKQHKEQLSLQRDQFEAEKQQHIDELTERKRQYDSSHNLAVQAANLLKAKANNDFTQQNAILGRMSFNGEAVPGETTTQFTGDASPQFTNPENQQTETNFIPAQEGVPTFSAPPQLAQRYTNQIPEQSNLTNTENTRQTYNSGLTDVDGKPLAPIVATGSPNSRAVSESERQFILDAPKRSMEILKEQGKIEQEKEKAKASRDLADSASAVKMEIADRQLKAAEKRTAATNAVRLQVANISAAAKRSGKESIFTGEHGQNFLNESLQKLYDGDISSKIFRDTISKSGAKGQDYLSAIGAGNRVAGGGISDSQEKNLQEQSKLNSTLPRVAELVSLINNNNSSTSLIPGTDAFKAVQALQGALEFMQPKVANMVGDSGRLTKVQLDKVAKELIPSQNIFLQNNESRLKYMHDLAANMDAIARANLGNLPKEQQDHILQKRGILPAIKALNGSVVNMAKPKQETPAQPALGQTKFNFVQE